MSAGGMVYQWKERSQVPMPAQVAGDEISRIRAAQGGFVTPAALVLAARPEDAPLHPGFEWSDTIAAAAYRIEQARYMLRSIVTIDALTVDRNPMRAFVSVSIRDEDNGSPVAIYTSIGDAMSDADMREQVIAQARADMRAMERKYGQIIDLARTVAAFNRALLCAVPAAGKRTG